MSLSLAVSTIKELKKIVGGIQLGIGGRSRRQRRAGGIEMVSCFAKAAQKLVPCMKAVVTLLKNSGGPQTEIFWRGGSTCYF